MTADSRLLEPPRWKPGWFLVLLAVLAGLAAWLLIETEQSGEEPPKGTWSGGSR